MTDLFKSISDFCQNLGVLSALIVVIVLQFQLIREERKDRKEEREKTNAVLARLADNIEKNTDHLRTNTQFMQQSLFKQPS